MTDVYVLAQERDLLRKSIATRQLEKMQSELQRNAPLVLCMLQVMYEFARMHGLECWMSHSQIRERFAFKFHTLVEIDRVALALNLLSYYGLVETRGVIASLNHMGAEVIEVLAVLAEQSGAFKALTTLPSSHVAVEDTNLTAGIRPTLHIVQP